MNGLEATQPVDESRTTNAYSFCVSPRRLNEIQRLSPLPCRLFLRPIAFIRHPCHSLSSKIYPSLFAACCLRLLDFPTSLAYKLLGPYRNCLHLLREIKRQATPRYGTRMHLSFFLSFHFFSFPNFFFFFVIRDVCHERSIHPRSTWKYQSSPSFSRFLPVPSRSVYFPRVCTHALEKKFATRDGEWCRAIFFIIQRNAKFIASKGDVTRSRQTVHGIT